jgi:hypothetical protein
MKKFLKQFSQILGMQASLLVATASYAQAAQATSETLSASETNLVPAEVTTRKSVFEDNIKSGKDPFFPKSARRGQREPVISTKTVSPIVQLSLKGISGPTNRRFALINNQPLAAGETAYVRIPGGQIKVQCWEIREESVVISIEGDPEKKELRLRVN